MKKLLVLCAVVTALAVPSTALGAQLVDAVSMKNPVHHGWNNVGLFCDEFFFDCEVFNWFSNEPPFVVVMIAE